MSKIILLLIVLLSSMASAQVKITGMVADKENNPIEFIEVLLLAQDSIAIKSQLTDEKGQFLLEAEEGSYILQIRQVTNTFFTKSIDVNIDMDLGIIQIDNIYELKSVVIEGKRKLIERKVDRVVFNVENSITASGSDAYETLKVTPGIRVQNDKIAMIGKSGLAVMIDDKLIQLSEEDLANYLKSLPSDDIKSIEVITTPPAKYEASGNSGLINIRLKKAIKNSWNALIGGTYLQRTYSDGSFISNFNYNKNKLSISFSPLNYRNGLRYTDQDDYAYFPDGLWYTDSPYKADYVRSNSKLSIGYQISPKWTMGSQYIFNTVKVVYTDSPYTPVFDYATGQRTRYLKSDGTIEQRPTIHSLNWYNEYTIDSLGRKISLNLDYFSYHNKDIKTYNGISVIESPYSESYFAGRNINRQTITNLTGKLDIEYPITWAELSFGGKISNSESDNDISFFNSGIVDDPVLNFPLEENKFEYTENVQALYISGSKKINEYWETQLGLRMEATQTKTFSENLSQTTKNNYVKFFPTAYLSYVPNDNSTFTLSYSKRIQRPQFNELNPNVYFANPFQTIEGNPFLQPAFIDNLEFTYTYQKLESKLYYSYENNLFSQIPIADPATNIIRYTNENYINTQRFGISENYVFDNIKWWTTTNTIDFNYAISKSDLTITKSKQEGVNSRIATNNDFSLNSTKTLFFNLSYWYSFPGIDGIYKNKAMSSFSLAIQYLLLNKNLKISLRGNDIFRDEIQHVTSTVNTVDQEGKYYNDNRSFQLSVTYKFGNNKINVDQRETGNEDERSRTGN